MVFKVVGAEGNRTPQHPQVLHHPGPRPDTITSQPIGSDTDPFVHSGTIACSISGTRTTHLLRVKSHGALILGDQVGHPMCICYSAMLSHKRHPLLRELFSIYLLDCRRVHNTDYTS
jgi:hypothetical protein